MKRVGQDSEKKILKIITGMRKSKASATQSELSRRSGLDKKVVRQILRRLRRQKKVKVTLINTHGNKKMRVYS